MKSRITAHSEYGKIESIILKKATDAFISEALINDQWQELNFTSSPSLVPGLKEYHDFEKLVTHHLAQTFYLPTCEDVSLDSIYCRDAAISTDHGLILCQMGKPQRIMEPEAIRAFCASHNIPILGQIDPPGTLEGGDVAWIDERTLAVGHTYRSNLEGIKQLKMLLAPFDIEVLKVDLPHYRGPSDVFHLMSIFSPIDRDVAVVYSPLMPVAFREELLNRSFHLIEVPHQEFDSMGCNVLAIAPRQCVIVAGNPLTKAALEQTGCSVFDYEGSEISLKGGGGPTCLTRPLYRSIIDTGFNE